MSSSTVAISVAIGFFTSTAVVVLGITTWAVGLRVAGMGWLMVLLLSTVAVQKMLLKRLLVLHGSVAILHQQRTRRGVAVGVAPDQCPAWKRNNVEFSVVCWLHRRKLRRHGWTWNRRNKFHGGRINAIGCDWPRAGLAPVHGSTFECVLVFSGSRTVAATPGRHTTASNIVGIGSSIHKVCVHRSLI